jgi:serpin B
MPYGKGAFLMEAIVPSGDFKSFVAGLSLSQLQQWDQSAQKQKTTLRFPKFTAEFDTDEDLVPVLKRLGMNRAFSSGDADFSNLSNESLYVSNFRQKTYVKLDEKGTEAAAVTIADMRKNAAEGLFLSFDRPFIYLIRESSTGAILFIGTKVK